MINPFDPGSWFVAFAKAITSWYTDAVKNTITFLLMNSVPSPDAIQSNFFSLALGGTYGLSSMLMGGVAIVLGTIILLRPRHDHSRSIAKMVSSIIWLVVFGVLFYRGYSLLYGFFQGIGQGAVNVLVGSQNSTIAQLNDLLIITNLPEAGAILLVGPFAVVFALFALAESFMLHIALLALLILYPLLIALRPLALFNTLFHAANSAVAVILISPILMAWAFALPVIAKNLIPGASNPAIQIMVMLVCSLSAFALPILIAVLVFNKSRQVFGRVDSSVEGLVSVKSMPPVDMNDIRRDIDRVHTSPLKAIASDVVGDEILNGNMFRDMSKVAVNAVATGLAAAGHPYASVAVKAAPGVIKAGRERISEIRSKNNPQPPRGGETDT